MNNSFGTSSLASRVATFKYNKPPHYVDTFVGTSASVYYSSSVYYANGWEISIVPGNPYTLTATVDSDVNNNNQPITTGSSYITTNWSFHFNTSEKELLHASVNGLNNTYVSWLNNITSKDKNTLEYFIANPPTSGSNPPIVLPIDWTSGTSSFNGSSGTSISASQVVWAMTKNGAKTIPIVQPVVRMTIIVPYGYNLSYFTSNLNRVHYASTVQSQTAMPNNFYNIMAQDTDPGSGTVTTDTGVNIPLHYGWLKTPPSIDQNGLNITIQQDWVYGLYYQNIYGTVL